MTVLFLGADFPSLLSSLLQSFLREAIPTVGQACQCTNHHGSLSLPWRCVYL